MDELARLRGSEGYGACVDAKQDKATGSCTTRGGHICPQCGQFWAFSRAFQVARKTHQRCHAEGKPRCFRKNSGVPAKKSR